MRKIVVAVGMQRRPVGPAVHDALDKLEDGFPAGAAAQASESGGAERFARKRSARRRGAARGCARRATAPDVRPWRRPTRAQAPKPEADESGPQASASRLPPRPRQRDARRRTGVVTSPEMRGRRRTARRAAAPPEWCPTHTCSRCVHPSRRMRQRCRTWLAERLAFPISREGPPQDSGRARTGARQR